MAPNKSIKPHVIELDSFWPYQLTVLADRVARRTSRIVRLDGGLNLSQWRVMAAIAEVPGRTSAEVVGVTPMDKGIVSRSIKALLSMGYVSREASPDDGRIRHLHLTTAGQGLYQKLMPRVAEVVTWSARSLSPPELATLTEHLRRLIAVIPAK